MSSSPFFFACADGKWIGLGVGVAGAIAGISYVVNTYSTSDDDKIYTFIRLPSDGYLQSPDIAAVLAKHEKENGLKGYSHVAREDIPQLMYALLEASAEKAVAQIRRVLSSDNASEDQIFASSKLIHEQISDLMRPGVFLKICQQFEGVLCVDVNGKVTKSEFIQKFKMVSDVKACYSGGLGFGSLLF